MTQVRRQNKCQGTKWVRRKAFREVHSMGKKETRLYFEKDVFTQRISHFYTALLLSWGGGGWGG